MEIGSGGERQAGEHGKDKGHGMMSDGCRTRNKVR